MSAEKASTKTQEGGRMLPPAKGVKVRMYRTGLGDCFLLAFPRTGQGRDAFYLLIDCGVYYRTPEPQNAPRIRRIVEDIRAATAGRLDLLVITHEHWDHVSAFHPTQAQSIFEKDIELGRLWMAWTENLEIPLARELHQGRRAARAALAQALTKWRGLTEADTEGLSLVGNLLDFFGGPVASSSVPGAGPGGALAAAAAAKKKSVQTEEAMEWIRDSYGKGKAKFLRSGEGPIGLEDVDDVRVYVLGPPEDAQLIRRHEPRGEEVYPKAMAAALEASFFAAFGVIPNRLDAAPDSEDVKEASRMCLPFDETYQLPCGRIEAALKAPPGSPEAGGEDERIPRHLDFFRDVYLTGPAWRKIDGDWLESAAEFALQLDNATNNTSLAFAVEIGPSGEGKVLLFPGDAQVGNWLSWFGKVKAGKRELGKDMVWTAGDKGDKKVTAEDLLRRTVLYKVGHHGSHNATLRARGLELMGSEELVAFLPVDQHVARELAHYGEMPLDSLVKELEVRTAGRVARSDAEKDPAFVEAATPLYFDYTVVP